MMLIKAARLFVLLLGLTSIATPPAAPGPSVDEREMAEAVKSFLTAFENLDWPRFSAAFSDDVTVFFPMPEPAEGFEGRAAVEAQFKRVFEEIRHSAAAGPPYQHLTPERLAVRSLGPSLGLVTFELRNAERVGRRTIVLRRQSGGWKIIHLHASNVRVSR